MASPILGQITKVPYDVLAEIFVHCLPQRRLRHRQPNTNIAPILLCHVCSAWRTVALATASLWSHLSFRLNVRSRIQDENWIVRKKQYAFLLWWKNNQRSMAPYLCLDLQWKHLRASETGISEATVDSEFELDHVEMTSLFEYISSARYLETGEIYWSILEIRILSNYLIVYPVLHTMVISHWPQNFECLFQNQVARAPKPSFSALRHLYLQGETPGYTLKIPTHWSLLTHLTLLVSKMSLNYWYTLIRAVPQLQMGHFQIRYALDTDDYAEPVPCILAQLYVLSIDLYIKGNNSVQLPLRMLVAALHLPALHDLSLSSIKAWDHRRALDHISPVLDAAPAITTLTLGPSFLDLQDDSKYTTGKGLPPRVHYPAPIWRHAPHLAHLRLVAEGSMFERNAEERRDAFVRNLFNRNNRWLDLNNAACPIRSVTIVDRHPLELPIYNIEDYTWSRIREYVDSLPDVKVAFDVIFETQEQAIAGAWNEWGPNLK